MFVHIDHPLVRAPLLRGVGGDGARETETANKSTILIVAGS